jgi:hypothetical protein
MRLSGGGGLAEDWVTQLLLQKMNRMANEGQLDNGTERPNRRVLSRSRGRLNSFNLVAQCDEFAGGLE